MAEQWDGRSRGTVLGYRIFVFFIKHLGLRAAYFLLLFVAAYFCIAAGKNSSSTYRYFRYRQGFSRLQSILSIYRSYFVFGQSIIDKVAIASGLSHRFEFTYNGVENIRGLLDEKKGGILISAHVGNFELAAHFFADLIEGTPINILTTDREHSAIKEYLEGITDSPTAQAILYEEDLSHIFEINAALGRNELICLTGDRYAGEMKTISTDLLGSPATFPLGPFHLGSRIRPHVLFVYVMRGKGRIYHLYAEKVDVVRGDPNDLLQKYVRSVEDKLKSYPYQWFNYFDFWSDGN